MVSSTTPQPFVVVSSGEPSPPTTGAISPIKKLAIVSLRRVRQSSSDRFATSRRAAPTNISRMVSASFSDAASPNVKLRTRNASSGSAMRNTATPVTSTPMRSRVI